jgi:cysteine-rich repeat protein
MCVPVVCGDNVVGLGEQCDDGNVKSCDGCNAKCQIEPKVGPNLNLAIPDDGYNGTLASMACVDLPVTAAGDSLVDSLCVQVGMSHTWIGDLTVKVVSPTNTVVTVMSRPGAAELADDGTDSPFGDSTNMDKAYPVTFVDAGAKSAELMGNTITDTQIVCKDDLACVYDPAAGAAIPGKFAAFNTQNAVGTWKVCVGDSGALDVGAIDFVRLGVVQ